MLVFAFYLSNNPAPDRQAITIAGDGTIDMAYLRVELVGDRDVVDELWVAKQRCRPDEAMLNTHPYPIFTSGGNSSAGRRVE